MRVLGVAILSVIAACYSPSYHDCEITCASGSCPGGFVCDQGVCRAEGFSGACGATPEDGGTDATDPNDVDGDGVANADDNCKDKANPSQANEDMDEYGDACDPCPPFGNAADNMDSDGDGVGDSCDPNPTGGHASIALFDGFAASSIDPVVGSGAAASPETAWSFAAGSTTAVAPADMAALLAWPVATTTQTVLAKLTVTKIHSPAQFLGAGITLPYDTSMNQGVICWITNTAGGPTQLQIAPIGPQMPFTPMSTGAPPLTEGSQYRIDFTRRGADFTCSEPTVPNRPTMSIPPAATTGTITGIFALGLDVRFEWVLAVDETQ